MPDATHIHLMILVLDTYFVIENLIYNQLIDGKFFWEIIFEIDGEKRIKDNNNRFG
jgi:hypothetical protein